MSASTPLTLGGSKLFHHHNKHPPRHQTFITFSPFLRVIFTSTSLIWGWHDLQNLYRGTCFSDGLGELKLGHVLLRWEPKRDCRPDSVVLYCQHQDPVRWWWQRWWYWWRWQWWWWSTVLDFSCLDFIIIVEERTFQCQKQYQQGMLKVALQVVLKVDCVLDM